MPRNDYQQQLESLREEVVAMGEAVLERYDDALRALESKDEQLAREVIESDHEINELYLELEGDCIDLFALQQPVAGDLRFITASFKIITDLERVADLATNLGDYALWAERTRYPDIDVIHIGEQAGTMLQRAIAAYEVSDADAAREIPPHDDEIDALCETASERVVDDLLRTEYCDETGDVVDDVSRLLLTIRDVERIGDHAVNVAGRTVYAVEGDTELVY
ncbi:phosphate signaling complex protein PhoU [Natronomonas sp.]|uniref:phosphate signaling complex protein PhoU n=1 Tax=Natronomonas sp. TaxID=2184060 RepID=UPI002FC3C5C8